MMYRYVAIWLLTAALPGMLLILTKLLNGETVDKLGGTTRCTAYLLAAIIVAMLLSMIIITGVHKQ